MYTLHGSELLFNFIQRGVQLLHHGRRHGLAGLLQQRLQRSFGHLALYGLGHPDIFGNVTVAGGGAFHNSGKQGGGLRVLLQIAHRVHNGIVALLDKLLGLVKPVLHLTFGAVGCIRLFDLTLRNAAQNPYTIRTFSNNPVLLKKVSSYGGIITMAGSIVMSTLFPVLMGKLATSAAGWTQLIFILMVPSTVIGLGRFIFCKEDPAVDAESKQESIRFKELGELFRRNKYVWLYAVIMLCYNIMTNLAVGAYYFKWIVGNISVQGLLSIVSFVLVPVMLIFPTIMKKIGSMGKMIFGFSIVGVVGYVIAFFSGSWLPGVFGGYVLGQLATLPIAYYGVLFIMNICTYNEILGMPRMDGSSAILGNFASKLGGALGAWVTGVLLSIAGYISAEGVAEQPASALMMIRIDFAIVPAILVLIIGICCLAFAKLEKQASEFEAEKKVKESAAAENA